MISERQMKQNSQPGSTQLKVLNDQTFLKIEPPAEDPLMNNLAMLPAPCGLKCNKKNVEDVQTTLKGPLSPQRQSLQAITVHIKSHGKKFTF